MWGGAPQGGSRRRAVVQEKKILDGDEEEGAAVVAAAKTDTIGSGNDDDYDDKKKKNNNTSMMRNLLPPEPTLLLHCRSRQWEDVGRRLKSHPEEATLMPWSSSSFSMRYGVTPTALSVAASSRAPLETIRLLVNTSRSATASTSSGVSALWTKPLLAVTHHRYGTVLHDALRTGARPNVVQFLIESMMEYQDENPLQVAAGTATTPSAAAAAEQEAGPSSSSRERTQRDHKVKSRPTKFKKDSDDDDDYHDNDRNDDHNDDGNEMLFHEYFGHVPTSDGRRSTNLRSSQIIMEPLALDSIMTGTTTTVAATPTRTMQSPSPSPSPPSSPENDTCLFAQRDYMGRTCLHYLVERIGRGLLRLQQCRRDNDMLQSYFPPAAGLGNGAAAAAQRQQEPPPTTTDTHQQPSNDPLDFDNHEEAIRALVESCQLLVSAYPVAVTVADNDGLIPLTLLLSLRPDDDEEEEEEEEDEESDNVDNEEPDCMDSSLSSAPPKKSACPMNTLFLQVVHLLAMEAPSLLTHPKDILQARKMFVGPSSSNHSANNNNNTNALKRLRGVYMHRSLRRLSSTTSVSRDFVERPLMRVHPNPLTYALLYSKSLTLIDMLLQASSCHWWNPLTASTNATVEDHSNANGNMSWRDTFSDAEDLSDDDDNDDDDDDDDDDEMENELGMRGGLRSSAVLMRPLAPPLTENGGSIAPKRATIAGTTAMTTTTTTRRSNHQSHWEQSIVNGCTVLVTNDREVPLHIAVTRRASLRVLQRLVARPGGWSGAAACLDRCGLSPIDWLWIRHVVDRTTPTDPTTRTSWSDPPSTPLEEEQRRRRGLPPIKASKRRYLPVTYDARWRVVLAQVEDQIAARSGKSPRPNGQHPFPWELQDVWNKAALLLPHAALAITTALRSCAAASRSTASRFLGPQFQWFLFSADTLRDYSGSKLTMAVVREEHEKNPEWPMLLHAATLLPHCPRALVLLAMHHCGDAQLGRVDASGNVPLHYAVGREWWNGWTTTYTIAAGVRKVTQTIQEPSTVPDLIRAFPHACRIRNAQKRLPLHLAIDSALRRATTPHPQAPSHHDKKKQKNGKDSGNDSDEDPQQLQVPGSQVAERSNTASLPETVRHTLLAYPEALGERDGLTNLYPFMLASVGVDADMNMTFSLLRENPTLISCGQGVPIGCLTQKDPN